MYEVKVNALLDRAEDPREMLGYSYARQQDFLREMHDAAVHLGASRNRASMQEEELRADVVLVTPHWGLGRRDQRPWPPC